MERALFKIQAANPPSSTLAKQASHLLEFIRPLLHRHYDALRLKKGVVVVGGGGAKEDSDHLLLDTSSIPPFDPAAYGAGAGAGGEDEDNSTAAYLAKKTRSAAVQTRKICHELSF